jgi:ABC-2 type transport system permease protein
MKYFVFNLKCSLEYRTSFVLQVVGMIINNSSFLFFWRVLFNNVQNIKGYTFGDIMVLWGLATSTYGFTYIFLGNVGELSNLIVTGGLDSYLIQPRDVVINSCASRTQMSAWGDFIYGFILFFISGHASIKGLLLFTIFTITGGLIFFSTLLVVNSLSLYFGSIESTKRMIEMFFITFSTYPKGIFGKYLRMMFYSILPIGFVVYMPSEIIGSFDFGKTLIVFGATILYLLIAYGVFYRGLKRYESGNLMEGKI